MIGSIRHKGLRRLFLEDDPRGVPPDQVARLRNRLAALNAADSLEEIRSVTGWRVHALKGDRQGSWSLWVSGNWRLIFRYEEGAFLDIDLVDYH